MARNGLQAAVTVDEPVAQIVRCHVCGKECRGRLGLRVHQGRSSDCSEARSALRQLEAERLASAMNVALNEPGGFPDADQQGRDDHERERTSGPGTMHVDDDTHDMMHDWTDSFVGEHAAEGDENQPPTTGEGRKRAHPDEWDNDVDDQSVRFSWLELDSSTEPTPLEQMPQGLVQLARAQHMRGWTRADVSEFLRIIREHIPNAPEWIPTSSTAYEKALSTGLVDERLRNFRYVEVKAGGRANGMYVRYGLDLVRLLLERHERELQFRFRGKRNSRGERVIDELWTSDAWGEMQERLGEVDIVPLIVGVDETTATSFTGRKAYPVSLTVGNLTNEARQRPQAREVWAYLPEVKDGDAMHRRAVIWAGMREVLSTIPPSTTVTARLAGQLRLLHVQLLMMQGDLVDRWRMSAMRGNAALHPCPCCEASKPNEVLQRRGLVQALRVNRKGSVLPLNPFMDSSVVGPFDVFRGWGFDELHVVYAGVVAQFFSAVVEWLRDPDHGGAPAVEELDKRFRAVPRHSGLIQLERNGAVERTATTCAVWATICTLLPFMLAGLADTSLVEAAHELARLVAAGRGKRWTIDRAERHQDLCNAWVRRVSTLLKIKTDTTKFHLFGTHQLTNILRFGPVTSTTTSANEAFHKRAVKRHLKSVKHGAAFMRTLAAREHRASLLLREKQAEGEDVADDSDDEDEGGNKQYNRRLRGHIRDVSVQTLGQDIGVPTLATQLIRRWADQEGRAPPAGLVRQMRKVETAVAGTYAVASPSDYHGAPCQDVVLLTHAGMPDEPAWVARLLATMACEEDDGGEVEVALVRFFSDEAKGVPGLHGVRVLREQRLDIVPAASVLARALLHPHPTKKQLFVLNDVA